MLIRYAFACDKLKVGMGLQIHIEDKEHAKYVENHVPSYIWKVSSPFDYGCCLWRFLLICLYLEFFLRLRSLLQAFVTQDEKDRDYLQKNIGGFQVPIINAREQNHHNAIPLTPQVLLPINRSIRLLKALLSRFSVKGMT